MISFSTVPNKQIYRWPSLSADLLFSVLNCEQNSRTFPSIGFGSFQWQKGPSNVPLLFIVWYYCDILENITPTNNKGCLYLTRPVSRQQQDRFRNKLFSHLSCRLFSTFFAAFLPTFLGLLFGGLF